MVSKRIRELQVYKLEEVTWLQKHYTIEVNTQQQTCITNFYDCKYDYLWKPYHLLKYFQKGKQQVFLSFLIRWQVTKEIGEIALLSTSHSLSDYEYKINILPRY